MRVEILLDGQVVNTQLVNPEAVGGKPTTSDLKKAALKAALRNGAISISQSLRSSFRMYDGTGKQIPEPAEVEWKS